MNAREQLTKARAEIAYRKTLKLVDEIYPSAYPLGDSDATFKEVKSTYFNAKRSNARYYV